MAAMKTPQLVAAFLESRRQQHLSANTLDWYRWVLGPYEDAVSDHPTAAEVQGYLGTAPTPETARNWLRAIRAMYHWAERWHGMENPSVMVTTPKGRKQLPRVFTEAELTRMLDAARRDPVNLAAVTVLLDTGIRIGELASIKTEQIEPPTEPGGSTGLMVDGKTGQRRVPLSGDAREALMRIAPPMGPVFVTTIGRPRAMAVATLNLRVRQCIQEAGITGRKVGPHTLRHTFATLYLRAGGDIYRLQRILGHSRVTQTMVYLHLSDPEAFAEHARLSPLNLLRRLDVDTTTEVGA